MTLERVWQLVGGIGLAALLGTAVSWGGVLAQVADHEKRISQNAAGVAGAAREARLAAEEARSARAAAIEARGAAESARTAAVRAAMQTSRTAGKVDALVEMLERRRTP